MVNKEEKIREMKKKEIKRNIETANPFQSAWITAADFAFLEPIELYHKELEEASIRTSAFTNYHVHFRKVFTISGEKQVILRISADDYYKLYINGEFVCQGPAAAYPEYYNYN